MVGLAALPLISRFAFAAGHDYPFSLGVASGDPLPDGFVIWTRLATQPFALDGKGGMREPAAVRWSVASDELMRNIVKQGESIADGRLAHSVHIEVSGLAPDRPYWYRFEALGAQSAVGQARTMPALGTAAAAATVGFVSCSNWEMGYFSAYRHLAAERPDLVFFLGDYIYDNSATPAERNKIFRPHGAPSCTDLAGYRNRYSLYKTDPDLQALHAVAPCVVTWDDHEVQNDYANRWSEDPTIPVDEFLKRRAAAYQAFYENMPLRPSNSPHGPDMRVYRQIDFGSLAKFYVLDGRQYRSEQPCIQANGSRRGHVASQTCADLRDPSRTMLGWEQERWLQEGFASSGSRWNVIAQDLLVAPLIQRDSQTGELGRWTDGWDGYPTTRERVLDSIVQTKVRNPVFWGGDIHSFWTTDLKADPQNPDSATVATEFVGSSITSNGPSFDAFSKLLPLNPHVRFFDSRERGYVSVDITANSMVTRFQAISDREDKRSTVSTLKRFVVEDGRAGAQEA